MSLPRAPAGSPFGPTRMKSLYITGTRFTPNPSVTNFSSCGLACTNTTSASPRRAVSSAWPVPCDTTFTSIPVLVLNSGRRWPNSPESWVEVVEATTIDLSCASAGEPIRASAVARMTKLRRWGRPVLPCIPNDSDQQLAGDEPAGLLRAASKNASAGPDSIPRRDASARSRRRAVALRRGRASTSPP